MKCQKCHETLNRLLLLALLEDAGARCSPGALQCLAGGEHNFSEDTSPTPAVSRPQEGEQKP